MNGSRAPRTATGPRRWRGDQVGLVVGDVRIAADEDQPALGVEDPQGQVGPGHPVGVVDVENRRPDTAGVGDPVVGHAFKPLADRLDALIVDGHPVPVDIRPVGQEAGDRDRALIGSQQVADVLRAGDRVVDAGLVRPLDFGGLAQERRMAGLPEHLDAVGGVADVGIVHGRSGDFLHLAEPQLELVLAARVGQVRQGGGERVESQCGRRDDLAVEDTGGRFEPARVARHASTIMGHAGRYPQLAALHPGHGDVRPAHARRVELEGEHLEVVADRERAAFGSRRRRG